MILQFEGWFDRGAGQGYTGIVSYGEGVGEWMDLVGLEGGFLELVTCELMGRYF
jgi:hypothetical protein